MRDLDVIADELYAVPPADFVAKRDEEATAAREAGDRALAAAVKKLPRPTQGAWLVNLLWREHAAQVEELFALGASLAKAQQEMDGPRIRELSQERQRLMSTLGGRVRRLAEARGVRVTADLSREVESTLDSALADAETAELVRSGRVVKAVSYAGFGPFGGGLAAAPTPIRSVPSPSKAAKAGKKPARRADESEDDAAERERQEAEARLAEAREVLEEAEEDYATREEALSEMESSRDSLRERLDELREEIRDVEGKLQAAERGLRADKRRFERAETVLEQARKRLADAESAME